MRVYRGLHGFTRMTKRDEEVTEERESVLNHRGAETRRKEEAEETAGREGETRIGTKGFSQEIAERAEDEKS